MVTKNRKFLFLLIPAMAAMCILCCRAIFDCNSLFHAPIAPDAAQSARQDISRWRQRVMDWQISPVDLSFLNAKERPAGRRGFVMAAGDALVFEDGSPARFWGANLVARALFSTSRENVKLQARRISALGFNLVRIHHMDSPWVKPNIFGEDATGTLALDPGAMEKLDWWIKCLKEEGIYIWLDLHVQRALTEDDHIDDFDEIKKNAKAADLKGYNYVNQSIRLAMQHFNEAYLNHVNVYTGVAYKREPAIMAMLLSNENDVTNHFGNLLLPDKNVPLHNRSYMELAGEFARQNKLPFDKTWRAWEPGPAKLFLNDLEHRFNAAMISHLRGLGVRVPIATTSMWGDDPLYSLPALTDGDIVDAHAYGEAGELDKSPLTTGSMLNRLSMAQVADKPMSVSEWNVSPFPVADRHSSPVYMAAAASLQGWDAVMLYAYAQEPLESAGKPSNWQAFNDPALVATLPAAALLYRLGHVKEAGMSYAIAPDRAQLFDQLHSSETSAAIRTASEKGKLIVVLPDTPELPWLKSGRAPQDARVIKDFGQSMIADNISEAISDTGEIRRDWRKGVYIIDTPFTQAALGRIGHQPIALRDVKIDVGTPNASVVVQGLDGLPIRQSSNLMISMGANAIPEGGTSLFHVEPVEGKLTISARKGLKLHRKKSAVQDEEIPVVYEQGQYVIQLERSPEASSLFLR